MSTREDVTVGAAGFQQEGIGHQAEAGAVRRADDLPR
jgi:hypothetical protein